MMLCSVYYERIIAVEHIRLPASVPAALVLNAYDDSYDTAESSCCDV